VASANPKILIIDDEPHVRSYVTMFVRATLVDPEIQTAGDYDEAVAAFTEFRPDLVLLDINMVGPSGLDVLRRLREIDPAAVVVMLTSVNSRRSVEEAARDGAQGYLLKETPHEQLADEFRAMIVRLFHASGSAEPALR
jgi:DNA-binding NarL/FixJ family response regulator